MVKFSYQRNRVNQKSLRHLSGRYCLVASSLRSTPMPGVSQTAMKPSSTIGSGSPSTISYHHLGFPTAYSKGDIILGQGCRHLNEGGKTDESNEYTMGRHKNTVHVCIFCNPLQFCNPADVTRVRTDYIHSTLARLGL